MAEAEGGGNVEETQQISMQISSFPRDSLQTLIPSGSNFHGKFEVKEEEKIEVVEEDREEEIELSLGLSLNGRFGVDPCSKRLKRCSSIPEFMNPVMKEDDSSSSAAAATAGCVVPTSMWTSMLLSRTCSLPVETEEAWRTRKELQTMRRMEAKRKRTEKQRNLRPVAAKDHGAANLEENCEEEKRIEDKGSRTVNGNQQYMNVSSPPPRPPPPTGVPNWVRGTGFGGCGIESKGERSDGFVSGGGGMDGLLHQGMKKCTEARSPANTPTSPEESDQEPAVTPAATEEPENPSKHPTEIIDKGGAEEMVRNMMLGMPSVSTKGDGLNCKTIQGLLYPYMKGEEVKILCVCHGSFLSPAEFVKHAGGGEVANPLKHIVVNPSSFF